MEKKLVVNGTYNRKAIMRKAWAYKNSPFCTMYRKNFKAALKAAWTDAKLAMDKYVQEQEERPLFPDKGLRASDLYTCFNLRMGYVTR